MSGMAGVGLGLAGQAYSLFKGVGAQKNEQDQLDATAKKEQDLINEREKELKQEAAQPAMIAKRQAQETMLTNLKNDPYASPLNNLAKLGGLK